MIGGTRRQTDLRIIPRTSKPCDDPIFIAPSWFSAPPGLTLPTGAGPIYWRNELLCRIGDIERNPGPKRALLREDETSCRTHYPLLRNTTTWPFQNLAGHAAQQHFFFFFGMP